MKWKMANGRGEPFSIIPAPDWRWLPDRADRPRYPAMRLFRQPRAMDWGAASTAVREELREKLKSGKPTG